MWGFRRDQRASSLISEEFGQYRFRQESEVIGANGLLREQVVELRNIHCPIASMISPYMKLAEGRSALRVNNPADRFLLKK